MDKVCNYTFALQFSNYLSMADCPPLTDPANGVVTVTGQTSGSTATYTCNSGFVLALFEVIPSETVVRTCQHGGTWSAFKPLCRGKCNTCTAHLDKYIMSPPMIIVKISIYI